MDISRLLELLERVLLTPEVIGVTVVMIVFFSLVNFVVYYRKKPAAPKPKKAEAAPAPAPAPAKGQARPGDEEEEEEESEADAKKKKKGGKRGKKADKGAKEESEEE